MCQVLWDDEVYREAASIWVDASDRVAVLDAIQKIDQLLTRDPMAAGMELSEGLHWVDQAPIRALFSIDEPAKRVKVPRHESVSTLAGSFRSASAASRRNLNLREPHGRVVITEPIKASLS